MTGRDVLTVLALILATFSAKCLALSSAENGLAFAAAGIKPTQQVIGIGIKRQDEMQGEALILHRKTRQELVNELESKSRKKNVYRVAKEMAKSKQGVVGVNCVKHANIENDQVKQV